MVGQWWGGKAHQQLLLLVWESHPELLPFVTGREERQRHTFLPFIHWDFFFSFSCSIGGFRYAISKQTKEQNISTIR